MESLQSAGSRWLWRNSPALIFGPLRDADLIETIERRPVVGPRCLQQVEDVLGVAQVGEIRRGDDQNISAPIRRAWSSGPLMRTSSTMHRIVLRTCRDRVEGIGAKIVDPLQPSPARQQAEVVGTFRQQAVDKTPYRHDRAENTASAIPLRGILL